MRINNQNLTKYLFATALFIVGILILAARNPDPLVNPIVYAEDGIWAGLGLTKGWLHALAHARSDYFVFFNIALLFLSTKISVLVSGNPITLLPESIAITSFAFFSAAATGVFIVTKDIAPTVFRVALYLMMLLIPLGMSLNEIIGRISNIGFYVPLIAVLLFFLRDSASSNQRTLAIDILVLLCAATNPVVFALAFLYLFWDFLKDFDLRACIWRNLTLIIPLGLLLAFLLPRMAVGGALPGKFVSSNFVETIIARAIAFPFLFPWYTKLSDGASLVWFSVWLWGIVLSFTISKNPASRRLMLFLMLALIVNDTATIVMRPGVTGILSNYQSSFPDRYFMGSNALAVFLSMIALLQISIYGNIIYKFLGVLTLSIVAAVYVWHVREIFEMHVSNMPIKRRFDFSEQLCLSKIAQDNSLISLVPIYPELTPALTMSIPTTLIDKSDCKFTTIPDDADMTDVRGSYKMQPSQQLNIDTPIKILMTHGHQDEQMGVKRIGVMFGTYRRHNPGDAELRLKGPEGADLVKRFSLPDLRDNQYRYFQLDARRYMSGEILSARGGGVSTWESHNENGGVSTCIIYEYASGKRRFTPGCPLL